MRIVITGASGFIGRHLTNQLNGLGYDIIELTRDENNIYFCNLLDSKSVNSVFKKIKIADVIIHTAAVAHGQKIKSPLNNITVNTLMVENLISAVKNLKDVTFIYLSSLSVISNPNNKYELNYNKKNNVDLCDYGKGKLKCEALLLESSIKKLHIIRIPPVYNDVQIKDISKRVYLPGIKFIKIKLIPSPSYSFLNVQSLITYTITILKCKSTEYSYLHYITDRKTYKQNDLLEKFKGITLPMPIKIIEYIINIIKFSNISIIRTLRLNLIKLIKPINIETKKIIIKHR